MNPQEGLTDNREASIFSRLGKIFTDRTLLILLGVFLVTRVVVMVPLFIDPGRWGGAADATIYPNIAENLLDGNGFSIFPDPPHVINSGFPPGYPYFLAGLYTVFGRSPYPAAVIHVLFIGLVLVMLYRFLIKRYGSKAALWMGIFFITDANLAVFSVQQLSEPLFLVLFIPALLLILESLQSGWLKKSLIAGLLLGLATLVRTITLYFAAPLLFFVLVLPSTWQGGFKWRRLAGIGIILVLMVLLITPWIIRNRVTFGHTFYSTVADINLYRHHISPLKSILEKKPTQEVKEELKQKALQDTTWHNEAEYNMILGKQARAYILKHPLPYAGMLVGGALTNLFYPLPASEMYFYFTGGDDYPIHGVGNQVLKQVSRGELKQAFRTAYRKRLVYLGIPLMIFVLIYSLFYVFKLGCGLRAYIKRGLSDPVLLLFLITGVYLLGLLGLGIGLRMRVPVEPLMASVAGIGIASIKNRKENDV